MVGVAPKIQILLGEVIDIDPKASEVVLNGQHLGYDQFILATVSGSSSWPPDRAAPTSAARSGARWPHR